MASFLLALPVIVVLVLASGCQQGPTETSFAGDTMGTTYHVKVVMAGSSLPENIEQQVKAVLDRVDQSMSTYKPDSELNRLNRHPVGQPFVVSADLESVLDISAQVYALTDGAFDPSVALLVDIWGFGPVDTGDRIPSDAEVAALVAEIGFDKLLRDAVGHSVTKIRTLHLDLSAVAKGYAVDKVAQVLRDSGVDRYMIELGGELALAGLNATGEPWRIAIETPSLMQGSIQRVLAVTDRGMATSGDYRNYFEKDGKRYSHTIDPRTGRPITHSLASVTVIAETAGLADALATGFDVLGADRAMQIADELSIPIFMLVKQDGEFKELYNQDFQPYLTARDVQGK